MNQRMGLKILKVLLRERLKGVEILSNRYTFHIEAQSCNFKKKIVARDTDIILLIVRYLIFMYILNGCAGCGQWLLIGVIRGHLSPGRLLRSI